MCVMSAIMEPVSFKRSTVYSPPDQFALKHTVTPIREHSLIDFIENNGHTFIDLRKMRLHIKCNSFKQTVKRFLSNDKVSFVNLPLQSL